MKLLLVLLLLALGSVARAQTTTTTAAPTTTTVTTTSSTTTTIAPSLQAVTGCVIASDHITPDAYHVDGHLTPAASYATNGMTLGVPNDLKAAGRCLCHSSARKPTEVLFGASNGRTFSMDLTNLKIKAFSTAATEVSSATDLSGNTLTFHSICQ